jgi:hypothetical protein
MLDELVRMKYPKEGLNRYLNEARMLKQNNYYTIGEYEKKINEVVRKIAICQELKGIEIVRKEEEIFYKVCMRELI